MTIPLVRDSGPDFLPSPTREAAVGPEAGAGGNLKLATPPTALEAQVAAAAAAVPGPSVRPPFAGPNDDTEGGSSAHRGIRTGDDGGVSHRISRDTLLTSSSDSSSFIVGAGAASSNCPGGGGTARGLTDSDISTPYGTLGQSRGGGGGGPGETAAAAITAGLAASSVSDSSASLFLDGRPGINRRPPASISSSAGGGGGGLSSPVPTAPIAAVPARFERTTAATMTTPQLAEPPQPTVPVFQLPPGLRVRERRRVNIRGGIVPGLVVPAAATASNVPMATPVIQRPAEEPAISTTAAPPPPPSAAGAPTHHDHGPAAEPQRQSTASSSSIVDSEPAPLPIRATGSSVSLSAISPGAGAGGRRTPREQLFPPRSEYIAASLAARRPGLESSLPDAGHEFVAPSGARKRSALSVMLGGAGGSGGGGEIGSDGRGGRRGLGPNANPFSRLYATCVSRASDAVRLTLYFPHAARAGSEKDKVEVGVKRDVTVEEVIGVGLWAYWEDEDLREGVKLEVDEREAREGTETVKWNLRIVEDDGEVDEDFPGQCGFVSLLFFFLRRELMFFVTAALDRLRNLTAFSFHEFAIVRASEQQSVFLVARPCLRSSMPV